MERIRRPKSSKESQKPKPCAKDEAFDILQKMKGMNEDLKNQMEEVYRLGRIYNIDVNTLLQNPESPVAQEWNRVQKEKDKLMAKMAVVVTPSMSQKKGKSIQQMTKERRGKTLGSRRNWMPMK